MGTGIKQRFALIGKMVRRPWFRGILIAWSIIGIWDTTLSQLVPEAVAKDAPRIYQIAIWLLSKSGGWIPFWGWLLIGAALLVIGTLEFAVRTLREDKIFQRYTFASNKSDKGWLDFHVDGVQAMEDMTATVNSSSLDTERFARGIAAYSSRVKWISSLKWKRRYASRVANYINRYSERLQRAVDVVGILTPVVAENQLAVIERETDTRGLQGFADVVMQTANSLPATIAALKSMRVSVVEIRGISADLNAASLVLEKTLSDYINKVGNVVTMCQQLHAATQSRIEKLTGGGLR